MEQAAPPPPATRRSSARSRRIRVAYAPVALHNAGSERQMLELAHRLPRDRFAVEFLLLASPMDIPVVADPGVPTHVIDLPRGDALPIVPIKAARGVIRFITTVRRRRYDIVDAWQHHGAILAAVTRPVTGLPILMGGRRNLSAFRDTYGWLERTADHFATRSEDVIVANSQVILERAVAVEGIDRARLRLIHNGVEVPRPMTGSERRAIRTAWGIRDGDVVVGCVSNHRPGKGLERLIDTVVELQRTDPRLRLVIVGHGPLRAALDGRIDTLGAGAVVTLAGHSPDAAWLCRAFDLFAHPSDGEGLPNAVLEAAAAGRAIVATDVGGTSEIVDDGATGLLVPAADAISLGTAILRLAGDDALRTTLGSAAAEHARRVFGMDRFVAETAALYEGLVAARGTHSS